MNENENKSTQPRPLSLDETIRQCKALWRLCFPEDTQAFIDLYFNNKVLSSNCINSISQIGSQIVAAFQILPYKMTYCGGHIQMGYLSGCCTHPDYRNQGIMTNLIRNSFQEAAKNGIQMLSLIPAEPSLFDYYARLGFATVFGYDEVHYRLSHTAGDRLSNGNALQQPSINRANRYQAEDMLDAIYAFMKERMNARPCCVQHSQTDYRVIIADLDQSRGRCCCTQDIEDEEIIRKIAADPDYLPPLSYSSIALAYPTANREWTIGEMLAKDEQAFNSICQNACLQLNTDHITVRRPPRALATMKPLGMARLIDAHDLLKRYAAAHPEADECLEITDPVLEDNNAIFLLSEGQCIKSINPSYKPADRLTLSIDELALWIFADEVPYMSLMLNL